MAKLSALGDLDAGLIASMNGFECKRYAKSNPQELVLARGKSVGLQFADPAALVMRSG